MNDVRNDDDLVDPTEAAVDAVWQQLEPGIATLLAERRHTSRFRSRRRSGWIAVGVGLVGVGVGGTAAARMLTGQPAPIPVQDDIAAVDEGMPADLRLNPDVTNARSVASDGDAVLYAADLKDGGVCTEVALGAAPLGAVCRKPAQPTQAIEVTVPGIPERSDPRVIIAGRVNVKADRANVVFADGSQRPVRIESAGFYVIELTGADAEAARLGSTVQALRDGAVIATVDVSAAFVEEPANSETLSLEMVSGPGDLTEVIRVYGTVRVPGGVRVLLIYPDGGTESTSINGDSSYQLTLAADRRRALADAPGRLVVVDLHGLELASRPVAAVSWWHSHD